MAAILSDEENIIPVPIKSSASDSDSPEPKIKKKRSTKRICASEYAPDLDQPSQLFGSMKTVFHSDVYSACISQKVKSTELIQNAALSASEDEVEDLFKKKPKRNQKKKTLLPKNRHDSKKVMTEEESAEEEDDDCLIEDYKPQVVMLEDEETDVESDDAHANASTLSQSQTREPTPPPEDVLPGKTKRMKRKVKKAFKKLEKAQMLHSIMTDNMQAESDISIIEVTSPNKSAESQRQLSVKIKSRSGVQRFPMKMTDSFAEIFSEMAAHENVSENQITMFLNDERVNLYDSPASLGLGIADIIECYIRKPEDVAADADDSLLVDQNSIKLRVQTKDAKSRLNINIGLNEPLGKLMREFCQKQKLNFDTVTFQFDGEPVLPHETCSSLELEDDYCIDVVQS